MMKRVPRNGITHSQGCKSVDEVTSPHIPHCNELWPKTRSHLPFPGVPLSKPTRPFLNPIDCPGVEVMRKILHPFYSELKRVQRKLLEKKSGTGRRTLKTIPLTCLFKIIKITLFGALFGDHESWPGPKSLAKASYAIMRGGQEEGLHRVVQRRLEMIHQ